MRFITPEKRRQIDPSEPSRTLLVIAAGLGRCATSSLHHAFENTLDLAPAMHFAYVAPSVERLKLTLAALNEGDKEKRQALLYQLFDGCAATSDYPGCFFVGDLMEMYPSAKLVLNKRSKGSEDWQRSMKTVEFFGSKTYAVMCYWTRTAYWMYQVRQANIARTMRILGVDERLNFTSHHSGHYEAHLDHVRSLAKARGVPLLEWVPEMGYEPLCKFIGKEIPKEPFPRFNDAKEMKVVKVVSIVWGLLLWVSVLGLFTAPVVVSYAWYK